MDLFKQLLRFSVEKGADYIAIKSGQNALITVHNSEIQLEKLGVIQPNFVLQVMGQLFGPKTQLLNQGKPVQGIMDLVGIGEVKTIGVLSPTPSVYLFMPQAAAKFNEVWLRINNSAPSMAAPPPPPPTMTPPIAAVPAAPKQASIPVVRPPMPAAENLSDPQISSQLTQPPAGMMVDELQALPSNLATPPEEQASVPATGLDPIASVAPSPLPKNLDAIHAPTSEAKAGAGIFSLDEPEVPEPGILDQLDADDAGEYGVIAGAPDLLLQHEGLAASPSMASLSDLPFAGHVANQTERLVMDDPMPMTNMQNPLNLGMAAMSTDFTEEPMIIAPAAGEPAPYPVPAPTTGVERFPDDDFDHAPMPLVQKAPAEHLPSSILVEFATPKSELATSARSPSLDAVLTEMLQKGASDLHLSCNEYVTFRIDGEVWKDTSKSRLTPIHMEKMLLDILPPRNKKELVETNDTDFAYEIPGQGRFRVNVFRDRNGIGSVMRHIPSKILTARELRLNSTVLNFCNLHKGLVLVTGPTGSGKSTTLAAMIDHINKTRSAHIITIEDPIEFVYQPDKCLINQREIGRHTDSFSRALRAALREDPDIVLVGEMRDLETIKIAIETAETGHLVFGTLHTNTAISTVDRIVDQFPADQQTQIRVMLSESLKGVISQTLLKRIGGGRVAAQEIMVVNRALSAILREGKTQMIANQMTSGRQEGNILLNEVLLKLVMHKEVEPMEAYLKSVDKSEFLTLLKAKGISLNDQEAAS